MSYRDEGRAAAKEDMAWRSNWYGRIGLILV